ncbi:MAG: hypothetical protein PHF05_00330 [Candidatus Izemoplasmatales bacterium]|nr:hypothetical protein [Candidatus Izemoplasmatales bacterium]
MKKLKRAGLKCQRKYISPSGSVYILVFGRRIKENQTIRVSNHHENARKLPKFNVLIGYGIREKVITNSKKFYYSGRMLDMLVADMFQKIYPKGGI